MAHINTLNSSVFTSLTHVNAPVDAANRIDRPDTPDQWNMLFMAGTLSLTLAANVLPGDATTPAIAYTGATGVTLPVTIPSGSIIMVPGTGMITLTAPHTVTAATGTIPANSYTRSSQTANTAGAATVSIAGGTEIGSIREFPSLGTPANVVNVPVYGQSTSDQIQGQPDAPSLEFTLNYVPTEHANLDTLRRAGTAQVWRVTLASTEDGARRGDDDLYDDFYFIGAVASFEVTPALNDAMQATMSITIQGDFEGPYSVQGGTYGLPS